MGSCHDSSAFVRIKDEGETCLEVTLGHLAARVFGAGAALSVHLQEFANVVFGCLEHLGFADIDILEGVDALAGLLDLATDDLWDELLDKLFEITAGCLAGHDVEHLFANLLDLGGLGVGCLLDLVASLLGEGNGEKTDEVAIGCSHVDMSLDEGLPFAHQRAKFV